VTGTVRYIPGGIVLPGAVADTVEPHLRAIARGTLRGESVAVAPHTVEVARLLRNLGVDVDSPIMRDPKWSWPGRFRPFAHQRETAAFLTLNPKAFVFNDMGTGKTAACIWACEYLRARGVLTSVLIASPLSTLHSVWRDELFNIAPGARVQVLYGPRAKRLAALATPADYYITNHDGLKLLHAELMRRKDIGLVVVDEASAFKAHTTQRFGALKMLAQPRWLWLMTGSPMPQSPLDAYGLAKLVCPHRVPPSHAAFRDMTMEQVTRFKWVPKKGAVEAVFAALQPAVRFSRADCLDLPPTTTVDRYCALSADQKKAVDDLVRESIAEIAGQKVTAVHAAARLLKLFQVCQGVVRNDAGESSRVSVDPRLEGVCEVIDETPGKALVFAPFRASIDVLCEHLRRRYGSESTRFIDGRTSISERTRLVREFQQVDSDLRILVLHPKAAGHGLTLTAASATIWYGPVMAAEQYEQANARADRPGQKNKVLVCNLWGHPVEREWYTALRDKQMSQQHLLDLYRKVLNQGKEANAA
jgi:SNF2 family DNA or RNA helicase